MGNSMSLNSRLKITIITLTAFVSIFSAQTSDSLKIKDPLFEISFGNTILFIPDKLITTIQNQTSLVIPTSALLFFTELRPKKFLRFPFFFNLPTETKQFLVDGQLVYKKANPTFGAGLEMRIFKVSIDQKTKLDLEMGPLASCIVDRNNVFRLVPVIAGRLRLVRGENFVMYFGGSFSFGINAMGLLYGTGTMF